MISEVAELFLFLNALACPVAALSLWRIAARVRVPSIRALLILQVGCLILFGAAYATAALGMARITDWTPVTRPTFTVFLTALAGVAYAYSQVRGA